MQFNTCIFVTLCCFLPAYAASAGYEYDRSSHGNSEFGNSDTSSNQFAYAAPTFRAEVDKEFFTFTAPEEEFEEYQASNQLTDSLKQNLRVIFIKGPENTGLENAALQLAKSGSDERLAIYVLSKQPDFSSLGNKLSALSYNTAPKPEVYFVKYRTAADADEAQRAIQSQYDGLGGTTSSHNGEIAPVLASSSHVGVASAVDPSRAYLPTERSINPVN